METKPGYLTTEFWLTIVSSIVAILLATGVVTVEDADYLKETATAAIPIIIGLYTWSRTKVKTGA